MKKALIITGGTIEEEFAKQFISTHKFDSIIVVDGGLQFVYDYELLPDIIIGDFDTVDDFILSKYMNNGYSRIIRLNPIKDSTDTEEAIDYAIYSGFEKAYILGGVGNRIDHSIGNLFLLKKAMENGLKAIIYTSTSKIFMISKNTTIKKNKDFKYISFIQFDGPAMGVTLTGFKYEVEDMNFDTKKTYSLGISNEFKDSVGEVKIKKGSLLVIMSKDDH